MLISANKDDDNGVVEANLLMNAAQLRKVARDANRAAELL